jgi:anti-sigma B factor antagonist
MVGDVAVVTPEGQFWGGKETDELNEKFKALIAEGNKKLVIDLGKVPYLNSTALGILVSVHSNYAKREGRVLLCNVEKKIQNVFVITKLSLIFEVQPDLPKAMAVFGS